MKRLALNGSPRGARSNTRVIIDWMVQGMTEAGAESPRVVNLARTDDHAAHRDALLSAEEIILVFPLYTDSLPGVVKAFIDTWADVEPRLFAGRRLAMVVQSGFPESIQSEPVMAYIERLCARLGLRLVGAAIRGDSEGLRLMPANMTRAAREQFFALGKSLVRDGRFDPRVVRKLGRPRRLGPARRALFALMAHTRRSTGYWDMMLKKHDAYERRFDQPYAWALEDRP